MTRTTTLTTITLALALGLTACSSTDDAGTTPTNGTTTSGSQSSTTASDDSQSSTTGSDDTGATSGDMGTSTGGDDAATTSGGTAGGYAEGACTDFFAATVPLSDRADAARTMIEKKQVKTTIDLDQINLLQSRIADVEKNADPEIAALLKEVNAPFTAAYEAMGKKGVVSEEGDVELPKIDTKGSADAQQELMTACQG